MNHRSIAADVNALPLVADWPAGYRSSPEQLAFQLITRSQAVRSQVLLLVPPSHTQAHYFPEGSFETMRLAAEAGREPLRHVLAHDEQANLPIIALRLVGEGFGMLAPILPRRAELEVGVSIATRTLAPSPTAQHAALDLDGVLAGSVWAREQLLANGARAATVVPTAVDFELFRPAARRGDLAPHFVIYSAGGLSHRKGQDIVLRAVAAFRQRHPDTILLTAWQAALPERASDIMHAGLVDTPPALEGGRLALTRWAVPFGIPEGALLDVGDVPQAALANLLSEVDVALFPNRAEYDQNTRLLECLAAGVPVIASDNTGHRDILDARDMWPLTEQRPLRGAPIVGTDGWGESSIDEIVAHLEWMYAHREDARRTASAARARIAGHAWDPVLRSIDEAVRHFAR
jgi:glycosyltransferase involved in cell wall biosynthesis